MKRLLLFLSSAFLLNLIWENAQAILYQPHGDTFGTFLRCAIASLGDVLMVSMIYLFVSVISKSFLWFEEMNVKKWISLVTLSIIVATGVEWWGISTYRWTYADMMPMIPFLNIGLIPVLQMALLNPLILLISNVSNRSVQA